MYSGVVNYATVMSYNDAIHSSADDILRRMNKVKSYNGHSLAYKLIGR
jgi:negative regulator of replication initiation